MWRKAKFVLIAGVKVSSAPTHTTQVTEKANFSGVRRGKPHSGSDQKCREPRRCDLTKVPELATLL